MSSISNLNRMAGLMSGLDTEALIKSMTANTKARIDSQKQKLQLLQWRQESYRSVISKISDFKSKYLDILSPTSIKANAIMNKYVAASSNEKLITATAASGATPGTYTISKASAATTAYFNSGTSVAASEVELNFEKSVKDRSYGVTINLDGVERKIRYVGGEDGVETKANFLEALNSTFADVMGDGEFLFKEGADGIKGTLVFDSGDDVTHTFSVGAHSGIGLSQTFSNRISTSMTLGSAQFANALRSEDGKYNITINGVSFEFNNNTTISDMMKTINDSNAGVKMSFSSISQTFALESKETGANAELNVYQSNGNLLNALFNWEGSVGAAVTADKSKKITYEKLDNIGMTLSSEYVEKLKKGEIGTIEVDFKNIQEEGESEYLLHLDITKALTDIRELDDENPDDQYTAEEIEQAFNNAMRDAYGNANGYELPDIFKFVEGDEESGVPDSFVIFTSDYYVKMNDENFGFRSNNQTFTADESYVIAGKEEYPDGLEFDVDGRTVTITAKEGADGITIQDLIDAGVMELNNGTLTAAYGTVVMGTNEKTALFLDGLFGKSTIYGAKDGEPQVAHGKNATIVISSDDGKTFGTFTSASNQFTFDGTTIDISNSENFEAASKDEYITIEVSRDTSGIMDVIKGFVEDYNNLLSELYGETSTSRPKTSGDYYDPLTDDMKEEMSDKEIEKWEEQAKIGLLYNDRNVNTFLSNLRGAMSTYVNGFGLADMGIHLTEDWKDNGKLEINETELENAINAYGDQIADFFTKASTGLAAKLENVVDGAISTNSNKYGYLSSLAGIEGTRTDNDNQIYRQLQSIQSIIDRLTEKYENEQERYWSRFTALETYMAKMQAQMSYFTDDSSSY